MQSQGGNSLPPSVGSTAFVGMGMLAYMLKNLVGVEFILDDLEIRHIPRQVAAPSAFNRLATVHGTGFRHP